MLKAVLMSGCKLITGPSTRAPKILAERTEL